MQMQVWLSKMVLALAQASLAQKLLQQALWWLVKGRATLYAHMREKKSVINMI